MNLIKNLNQIEESFNLDDSLSNDIKKNILSVLGFSLSSDWENDKIQSLYEQNIKKFENIVETISEKGKDLLIPVSLVTQRIGISPAADKNQ